MGTSCEVEEIQDYHHHTPSHGSGRPDLPGHHDRVSGGTSGVRGVNVSRDLVRRSSDIDLGPGARERRKS